MPALTDISDLINRQTGGNNGTPENLFFFKTPRISGVAPTAPNSGRMLSLWQFDGMPASGSAPTVGAIPTRTTTGAISFTAPGGAREKWLINVGIHIGNVSTTLTMTYTDQDGNAGQTSTINIGATGFSSQTRMQRIPLAAGDTGVREVEKIRLTASTTTAGNFGITIGQPLAWIPVGIAGGGGWRDYTTGLPGIPAINPDACLSLALIPTAGTAPEIFGCLGMVEK